MSILQKIKRRFVILSTLLKENDFRSVFRHLIGSRLKMGVGKAEMLTVHGHQVLVRRGYPDLRVAIVSLGGEFDALKRYCDKDFSGLIVDAGGFIGTAALAFSDAFPNATIVSVEASSSNAQQARLNTSSRANIHVLHAALTASDAPTEITLRDRGTGAWGFTIVEKPADRVAHVLEKVKTMTMDAIIKKYGFGTASIVELDIEGAELELLREPSWLSSTEILLVELHDRIAPGCEEAFIKATEGRQNMRFGGEKYISVPVR